MNEEEYKKTIQKLQESTLKIIDEKNKQIADLEEAKDNLEYLLEGRDNEIDELKKENKVLAQNLEDTEILNNTYEKRFDNLKKENAELKNKLEHRNCLDCSNHSSKLRMRTLELEKENAELKRENRGIKTCANCDEYVIGRCCNYPNGVCHHWKLSEKYRNDDELTTAKEIIKRFSEFVNNGIEYDPEHPQEHTDLWNKLCEEAEQFLNENSTYERIQKAKYNYTN